MKYIWLTFLLILFACDDPDGHTTGGQVYYDTFRPPIAAGAFSYISKVVCSNRTQAASEVYLCVYDSLGAPLQRFTIKGLKKPYSSLANTTFFYTDQTGLADVVFRGCDSLELANLSILTGRPCRISTSNLPDTIKIWLSLSQERFISSTL